MKSRPFDRLFDGESVKADRKPVRLTQPSHPSFPSVGFCTFDERCPSVRDCQDAWPTGASTHPQVGLREPFLSWLQVPGSVGSAARAVPWARDRASPRSSATCVLASVSAFVSVRCCPAAKLSGQGSWKVRRCCGWMCACCCPSSICRWCAVDEMRVSCE